MGLVILTFDLVTLKLVCEAYQRWGTFVPNLGTLGLRVLQLFAMYVTDGQKQRLLPASLRAAAQTFLEHTIFLKFLVSLSSCLKSLLTRLHD